MLINSVIPHFFFYKHSQIHVLCFQKLILAKWLLCWNYILIRVILWYCRELNLHLHVDQTFDGIIWYSCFHAMVTVNICEKFCWKNDNWQIGNLGKFFLLALIGLLCFSYYTENILILILFTQQCGDENPFLIEMAAVFSFVNFPYFLSDIKGNVSFIDWYNSCHSFDETAWILTIERIHD